MKKYLSFFLALILIAGLLSVGAAAAGDRVMVSRQNLRVDGVTILCEKYNINDRNYFKLRDLAQLVNGTGSQFDVDYDVEAGAMIVTTGQPYTHPNGTELKIGEDNSAKAKRSPQTLYIDGEKRSDLTAYNIDGTNFFQLRELEDVLGFKVDYDQPSNTAIIISKRAPEAVEWLVEERVYTSNEGYTSRSTTVYNADGRMVSYTSDGSYSTETTTYSYDELGRNKESITESHVKEGNGSEDYRSRTTWEYDIWGNLAAYISEETGDVITESLYAYDEYGREVSHTYRSNYGEYITRTTYDQNGYIARLDETDSDGSDTVTVYERDARGNMLKARRTDARGNLIYQDEYTYDANGNTLKNLYAYYNDGEKSEYVYTYQYDSKGRLIHSEITSAYYHDVTDYIYDKGDRMVRMDCQSTYGSYTELYQYDDQDRRIRTEHVDEDGTSRVYESVYEGDRLVKDVENDDGVLTVTEYTYNDTARKMTVLTTVTYPLPTAIAMSEESLLLAAGDEDYLYVSYTPGNALYEHVEWSSSDPAVAVVDEYGTVTAVAPGEATITAVSASGLTAVCRVTVAEHKFTLTVEPESQTVSVGKTKAFHITVEHIGSWQSSKPHVRGYDSSLVSISWDEWYYQDGLEMITFYVKGLALGETTFDVYLTHDDEFTGELVTVTVTVVN